MNDEKILKNKFKIGERVWFVYENFEQEICVTRDVVISIASPSMDKDILCYAIANNSTPAYQHRVFKHPDEAVNCAKELLEIRLEDLEERFYLYKLYAEESCDRTVKFIEEFEENE